MRKHLLLFPKQIKCGTVFFPYFLVCKKTTFNSELITNKVKLTTCKNCKKALKKEIDCFRILIKFLKGIKK